MQELNQLSDDFCALSPRHEYVSYNARTRKIRLHLWVRYDGDDYGYQDAILFGSLGAARAWVDNYGKRPRAQAHDDA